MKHARWLVPALLLLAGVWLLVLRGPERATRSVDAPPQEKQAAIPPAETAADLRHPIAVATESSPLPIAPASNSISARVVDPSGDVVSGAEVWFSDGSIDELQGVSDAEGLVLCTKAHWR